MKLFILISSLLSIQLVSAYDERSGLCTDDITAMLSGMGGRNNQNLSITVEADNTSYKPGKPIKITVKVSGNAKFKGLLLYARNQKNVQIGQWDNLPSGFQTLDEQCKSSGLPKSVLSHSDSKDKGTMTFTWTAPNKGQGPLEIRGIVVSGKTNWRSVSPIRLNGPGSASEKSDLNGSASSISAGLLTLFGVLGSLLMI